MSTLSKKSHKLSPRARGVIAFLTLCFFGAWGYLYAIHAATDLSLVNPIVQLPMAFIPAIVAVVIRRYISREGFADAGLRPHFRRAWPYYLLAWLGPLALVVATVALASVLGLWGPSTSPLSRIAPGLPVWAPVLLLMVVAPLMAPLYWGEEFGWTGYLRSRLLPGRPVATVLTTGLIWGVWHYPLAFLGYVEYSRLGLGLLLWTVSFVCQQVLLGWLRTQSGTIWTASVAHAGNNLVLATLVSVLLVDYGRPGDMAALALSTVPLAVLAAVLLLRTRREPVALVTPEQARCGSQAV